MSVCLDDVLLANRSIGVYPGAARFPFSSRVVEFYNEYVANEAGMTRHLVTEAGPIAFEHLTQLERERIAQADEWLEAVVSDAARAKQETDAIGANRGRVLLIDGPRGAGKTSMLLTLLKRWQRWGSSAPDDEREDDDRPDVLVSGGAEVN